MVSMSSKWLSYFSHTADSKMGSILKSLLCLLPVYVDLLDEETGFTLLEHFNKLIIVKDTLERTLDHLISQRI